MSTTYNLSINRRDHKIYNLTFKDANGVAIDITGWTIFFTAKSNKTDTDDNAKITKTVTSHSDPTNGITELTLTPTDTDTEAGTLYYDIQIKKVDGTIITPLIGELSVIQDITIRTS